MHYHAADHFSDRNKYTYALSIVFTLVALYLSNSKSAEGAIAKSISLTFRFISYMLSIDLNSNGQVLSQLLVTFISFLAVIIFSWQLFARYEERQSIHRLFSTEYFNIARKIERIISADLVTDTILHDLSKSINVTAKHAPTISSKFWENEPEIEAKMKETGKLMDDLFEA